MTPVIEPGELRGTQLRPLRKVEPGVWKSRDGIFTFTGPAAMFNQGTSNEVYWHVHMHGMNEAWGDRFLTLGDAAAEVEAEEYAHLKDPRIAEGIERRGWRNPAFAAAYRKGWLARFSGAPQTAVPYGDDRTHRGGITYARAFAGAWHEGWEDADGAL